MFLCRSLQGRLTQLILFFRVSFIVDFLILLLYIIRKFCRVDFICNLKSCSAYASYAFPVFFNAQFQGRCPTAVWWIFFKKLCIHVYLWQTWRQDLIIWSLKDKLVKCLIENQLLTAVKCSHSCCWFGYTCKMLYEFQWFRRLCLLTRNMLKRQTNKTRNYGNSWKTNFPSFRDFRDLKVLGFLKFRNSVNGISSSQNEIANMPLCAFWGIKFFHGVRVVIITMGLTWLLSCLILPVSLIAFFP